MTGAVSLLHKDTEMKNLALLILTTFSLSACASGPGVYTQGWNPVGQTVDNRAVWYDPATTRINADGYLFVWTRWIAPSGVATTQALQLNCADYTFRQVQPAVSLWTQANNGYAIHTLIERICS